MLQRHSGPINSRVNDTKWVKLARFMVWLKSRWCHRRTAHLQKEPERSSISKDNSQHTRALFSNISYAVNNTITLPKALDIFCTISNWQTINNRVLSLLLCYFFSKYLGNDSRNRHCQTSLLFRWNAAHCISLYAIVVCVCLSVCVCMPR